VKERQRISYFVLSVAETAARCFRVEEGSIQSKLSGPCKEKIEYNHWGRFS
jgi:hypothetical protein